MIQLDLDKSRLEDSSYILEVLNTILLNKIIEGENQRLQKCFDFYEGKEPRVSFKNDLEYECRVVNLTKPIVDIATKTFIGELPDIVTSGDKEENDKISVFSQKLYSRQFGTHIYETCHYGSKCGSGYLAVYNKIDDDFPRFRELNPQFTEAVYDCSMANEHLLSYWVAQSSNANGGLSGTKYVVYVYTKKHIFAYESVRTIDRQTTKSNASKDPFFANYMAWTINGQKASEVEHGYDDIPIIEFPNNADYKGDAECVFDLITLYNEVTNNRCKNLYDIINYVLMLKNVDLGNDEETKKAMALLKENHVLPIKGDNVDAEFLSNQINQEQMQTLANNIKDLIHLISRVPDLSGVDFSQNASDPIIKIKTKPLLDLCSDKEKWCNEPYLRVIKMVLAWCKKNSKDYGTFDFDTDIASLSYTHTLPSNDGDMITMITNLANSGMADPEVLLQNLSFIPSVHDYIKGMEEWNKEVDKRKALNNNNNKDGVNPTNLERQNKEPLTKDNMDNKSNFNEGNANTKSDLK